MNQRLQRPPAQRAGPQPIQRLTVGQGVDLAARNGFGAAPCRWLSLLAVFLQLLVGLAKAHGQIAPPDLLYMRDGQTLSGNIVGETPDAYRTLLPAFPSPLLTNVSVKAVRYVVYGTPAKARASLRLDETARALGANDPAKIEFLPTDAFGEAIAVAVEAARERVWILAYYISGGSHPAIQRFYEGLRGKARSGMDVRVISEFGKGTPMPIRNGTLNFAHTLQDDGVAVRFIQEYRVMHKKLLLVDRDKVLLGSSNLTGAGVDGSDEFNVLIASEPFARQAEADIKRLAQQAQLIEKLEY